MTNDLLQARLDFYLELRRSLGYKTYWPERVLRNFLAYHASQGQAGPIRAETALDWARQASALQHRRCNPSAHAPGAFSLT